MSRQKRAEKRARVEGRTGVTWRSPSYVVEMRLSKRVGENLKLHFGSYRTRNEAMVARDYAAYVRDSTGREDRAAVGGFIRDDRPSIFYFSKSREVFESLEGSDSRARARCDRYKSFGELAPEARERFHEAAKEDIRIAIESFRRRDSENFPLTPPSNGLANAEPVDGEIRRTPSPSRSEVMVSSTPGRGGGASMGEGSTNFIGAIPLEVQFTVDGSPFQTVLQMNVPGLTAEEILRITKAGIDRIQRELIDKWWEGVDPCPIAPETIPALE